MGLLPELCIWVILYYISIGQCCSKTYAPTSELLFWGQGSGEGDGVTRVVVVVEVVKG